MWENFDERSVIDLFVMKSSPSFLISNYRFFQNLVAFFVSYLFIFYEPSSMVFISWLSASAAALVAAPNLIELPCIP